MISITIIGTGNIATHLCDTFSFYDNLSVIQIVGRSQNSLSYFLNRVDTCLLSEPLKKTDVFIIAVSDDAIPEVSAALVNYNALVVHTSGSVPMSSLSPLTNIGVFYPFQSFTKGKKVNFREIPMGIEAAYQEDLKLLHVIAETISDAVYEISSEQRKQLHLAAVFVNNFTNYMYTLGHDICEQHEVPFDILKPLITETAAKIEKMSPSEAQTGPARRNDVATMQGQLEALASKNSKKIYKLLSEAIQKKYGKEL